MRSTDPALAGQLTPEDIDRTSRTAMAPRPTDRRDQDNSREDYALSKVDFSDPSVGVGHHNPESATAIVIGFIFRPEKALAGIRAFNGNQTDAPVELA